MFYFGGLFGALAFLVWVWAIFDVIASEEVLVRNLPKFYWLILVIFVPTVGAIAWFALGRPDGAGLRPGSTDSSPTYYRPVQPRPLPPGPRGPEDSPEFLASLEERKRLERWEEQLRRREEELRRRELGDGEPDENPQ